MFTGLRVLAAGRGTSMNRCLRSNYLVVSLFVGVLAGCGPDGLDVGDDASALGGRMGVDYSFARPSPSSLRASGFTFAARYLSDYRSKNISHSEATALEAAGVDVVANWED